jgi:hypothetical protein
MNETYFQTEFVTKYFDVSMSDFGPCLRNKELFIPLVELCILILRGPALQYGSVARSSNSLHRFVARSSNSLSEFVAKSSTFVAKSSNSLHGFVAKSSTLCKGLWGDVISRIVYGEEFQLP